MIEINAMPEYYYNHCKKNSVNKNIGHLSNRFDQKYAIVFLMTQSRQMI